MKSKVKSIPIKQGMFFPEDFKKLPKTAIIYIETGKLIVGGKG